MECHYRILELKNEASELEIKNAFKKLSKIYHPDKGGDEEKYKQIVFAYESLIGKQEAKQEIKYDEKQMKTILNIGFATGTIVGTLFGIVLTISSHYSWKLLKFSTSYLIHKIL